MKTVIATGLVLGTFCSSGLHAQSLNTDASDGLIDTTGSGVLTTPEQGDMVSGMVMMGLDTVPEFTYNDQSWQKAAGGLTSNGLAAEMVAQGWIDEEVTKVLPATSDVSWSVYRSMAGPGKIDYMAVPNTAGVDGYVFQSGGEIQPVQAAFSLGSTVTAIQETLMEGMMMALKGACDLPVRPNEIKASASAGVVGVEATWNTTDVCDRLPNP